MLAGALSLLGILRNEAAIREDSPTVPDIETQFAQLGAQCESLGFRAKGTKVPSGSPTKTHYQGIVRRTGPGTPYFFVARSGMDSDDEGRVHVVQMGSRLTDGERLRSNRLKRGTKTWDTAPGSDDAIVWTFRPGWQHVGGLGMVGDILVVPLEDPLTPYTHLQGAVWFYDVSTPTRPRKLDHLAIEWDNRKAGVAGITRLPDRHFLLAVTWGDGDRVRFYRSTHPSLVDEDCRWTLLSHWDTSEVKGAGATWPTGGTSFQGLSLHVSRGAVYMVGMRNTYLSVPFLPGGDEAYLYRIDGWQEDGTAWRVEEVDGPKNFDANANGDGLVPSLLTYNANFLAGAATHVTPSGELLLYAIEHFAHGEDGTVRMAEWRHRAITREGGDLLAPKGRFEIPEFLPAGTHPIGVTNVSLYGMRPWIQLYDSDDYAGARVVVDYADYGKDDYDDLRKLDGSIDGFNDRTSSLRWWAPPGWRIRLHDQDNLGTDEPTLTLDGDGTVRGISNLSSDKYSFDNGDQIGIDETRVTSVQFLPPADFDRYDEVVRQVQFEWFVQSAVEGAATVEKRPLGQATLNLHKPGALVDVTVRMTGPNGEQRRYSRKVRIVNTPPEITRFDLNPIGQGIVQALVSVRDAGTTNRLMLKIDWGDGRSTIGYPQSGGSFGAQHRYADVDPRRPLYEDFTIRATVTDADGVVDSEAGTVDLESGAVNTNRLVRVVWRNAEPGADTDADGLPDVWEQERLGGLVENGREDSDADGVSNADELVDGTHPADADDLFRVTWVRSARDLEFRFPTRALTDVVAGRTKRVYRIQSSVDPRPDAATWRTDSEVAGDGSEKSFRITSDRQPMQFFRVLPELK